MTIEVPCQSFLFYEFMTDVNQLNAHAMRVNILVGVYVTGYLRVISAPS